MSITQRLKNSFNGSTHSHYSTESKSNKGADGKSDSYSQKILVTVERAQEWLSRDKNHNRRLSERYINQYAADMASGRWKTDTFEFIKIAKSGRVIDGNHRLHAVIKAKVPIVFHVAFNVPDDVFDSLDTGKSRNASDVFKIAGIGLDNVLPSIIRQYYILVSDASIKDSGSYVTTNQLTNSQVLKEFTENENFWTTVAKRSLNWYNAFARILRPSVIGGVYALFNDIDQNASLDFMHQLSTGSDIKNKVILLLRDKLMKDKMAVKKMPPGVKLALIIKAWNIYRTGKESRLLKFDTEREEFPIAK